MTTETTIGRYYPITMLDCGYGADGSIRVHVRLLEYTPPATEQEGRMEQQTSAVQDYWRQRLGAFPTERPEGFEERRWELLSRHVLDGYSMAELATEFGLSKGRVQQLLRDAHHKLKEALNVQDA